jgi:hypothetical protein
LTIGAQDKSCPTPERRSIPKRRIEVREAPVEQLMVDHLEKTPADN